MDPGGAPRYADTITEVELVGRLRAGDDAAYDYLVRQYTPRLLAVARRLVGSDEDARDALQEGFLAAFRSIHRFEGSAQIATWLHRIVVNACLMKLRSRRRRPEEPIEPLLPAFREDGHHEVPVVAWGPRADQVIEQRQTRALVRDCIARLPESYRTVLMLRDIEGLDTSETAKALALTPTAVKLRLHRARLALRTLLDPHLRGGAP